MDLKIWIFFLLCSLVVLSACTAGAPPVSPTGTLEVNSTPAGSEVYLEGLFLGITPMTLSDLPAGTHRLELRYLNHTPWSRDLNIHGGERVLVDAALLQESLPATRPVKTTAKTPTTRVTVRHTTIAITNPVPGTPAGCWKMQQSVGNSTYLSTLALAPGGSGWMNMSTITDRSTDSVVEKIRWIPEKDTALITLIAADPYDPEDPDRWLLSYDPSADLLDAGEKGGFLLHYLRTPC